MLDWRRMNVHKTSTTRYCCADCHRILLDTSSWPDSSLAGDQGVASGGAEQRFRYSSKFDLYFELNTEKPGLWKEPHDLRPCPKTLRRQ
jgi:hypothetical protein